MTITANNLARLLDIVEGVTCQLSLLIEDRLKRTVTSLTDTVLNIVNNESIFRNK